MAKYSMMGIVVSKRRAQATHVQEVLTRHGCLIKARLGLHETGDACAEDGLMILQLVESDQNDELCADLNALEGVTAELVVLEGK